MLLTNLILHDNIYKVRESDQMKQAAVAQSVERRIGSAEVTGPIPVSSCEKPLCLQGFFLLSKMPGTKPGKIPIGSRHSN